MLFLPAPFYSSPSRLLTPVTPKDRTSSFSFADLRLIPHYPAKSSLDNVLLKVVPGADEYITEKYALEITQLLDEWSSALKTAPPSLAQLTKFLDPSIQAASLLPTRENTQRSRNGIEILRRRFPQGTHFRP